jgi:outer membrane biosynthesis protein TonB
MPTETKYNRILAYLKGLLSHRQRHDLEKEMMQDIFEEEAFEGLSRLSGSELANDMELLRRKLDSRIMPAGKTRSIPFFRIAAAIVLLIGVSGVLYFVLRTPSANLLTDDHKTEKPVVRSAPAPAVVGVPVENEKQGQPIQEKKVEDAPQTAQEPVENLAEQKEEIISQPVAVAEKEEAAEPDISPSNEPARSAIMRKSPAAPAKSRKVISGMVVDNNGDAMPGVTVTEKGTGNGTVSDVNGKFMLALQDTSSRLNLSFIGYKPIELKADASTKDKIVMEEDLVALNEVVVTGYGTQRKADATGAVSSINFDEDSKKSASEQPVITKPVPPGGSLRAFKKWVNDRLDYPAFKEYPGKHKFTVLLTVNSDGTIGNIRINQGAPDVVAADLKKVISQSSLWTAALKDGIPLDAEVEIHFVITVE